MSSRPTLRHKKGYQCLYSFASIHPVTAGPSIFLPRGASLDHVRHAVDELAQQAELRDFQNDTKPADHPRLLDFRARSPSYRSQSCDSGDTTLVGSSFHSQDHFVTLLLHFATFEPLSGPHAPMRRGTGTDTQITKAPSDSGCHQCRAGSLSRDDRTIFDNMSDCISATNPAAGDSNRTVPGCEGSGDADVLLLSFCVCGSPEEIDIVLRTGYYAQQRRRGIF